MAKITRVEILMVDLVPKVKRTDAIQSFVSQETPIVTHHRCRWRGRGGLQLYHRHRRPVGHQPDAPHAGAAPDRARGGRDRGDLARPLFLTHATAVGAITSLALAAIDTACGTCAASGRACPCGAWRAVPRPAMPLYTTEGGWLHIETQALVEDAIRVKEQGFGGSKVKVGRPHVARTRAPSAVREAVGDDFEIMTDANQAFQFDEAIRRAHMPGRSTSPGSRNRCPPMTSGGHVRLSQSTTIPIAVGESLYSPCISREYLRARRLQHRAGRCGARRRHHPMAQGRAYGRVLQRAVCPHFLMELHVSLCAAVPNARWVEYIPQIDIADDGTDADRGRPCNTLRQARPRHSVG
jgi:L-alanine-DL-glutamate epimerase-like enolase superfamily enzyme